MTKVTTLRPEHSHLHPYFMRASALDDTVTACLWTELDNIDMLSTWAARWKGASVPVPRIRYLTL